VKLFYKKNDALVSNLFYFLTRLLKMRTVVRGLIKMEKFSITDY